MGEYLPEPTKVLGNILQDAAFADGFQQSGVDLVPLQISGIITPGGDNVLYLLRLFGGGANCLRDHGGDRILVFSGIGIDHFPNRRDLPLLAFRFIGSGDHLLLQLRIRLLTPLHPLQKLRQFLLGLVCRILQLLQGVQRVFFAADASQKLVQLICCLCDKFTRRLISGQLPALADRFQRGKILALGNVIQNRRVELPGLR